MTEATQIRPDSATTVTPTLQYWVGMPKPESHLFEIRLKIQGDILLSSPLDLKMPVWTPGSYLVREYARHLQDFRVCDSEGNPLKCRKKVKIIGKFNRNRQRKFGCFIEFLPMN